MVYSERIVLTKYILADRRTDNNDLKKDKWLVALLFITAIFLPLQAIGMDSLTDEYVTRSGKSLFITESHPVGQSLSDISIKSSGFEHNISETFSDSDPIKSVYVTDLDNNGFDEFYLITVSSGSGSYGNVIGFASNNDKSLSMIHFPNISEGDERFTEYMGHDNFKIANNRLIRSFPIYLPTDKNAIPTGGTRHFFYELFPGEAAWQLKITDVADSK